MSEMQTNTIVWADIVTVPAYTKIWQEMLQISIHYIFW